MCTQSPSTVVKKSVLRVGHRYTANIIFLILVFSFKFKVLVWGFESFLFDFFFLVFVFSPLLFRI